MVEIAAALLASDDLAQSRVKLLLLERFSDLAHPGAALSRHAFETLIFDLGLGLEGHEVRELLISTGLWTWTDEEVQLRERVELADGFDGLGRPRTLDLDVAAFLSALSAEEMKSVQRTPTDVAEAIWQARRDLLSVLELARSLPSGLPTTFWIPGMSDRALVPLGDAPSVITLLDIVNCRFEAASAMEPDRALEFVGARWGTISSALDRAASFVITDGGDPHRGLLFVDGDDDFVESGLLPNVPTIAHFLRAFAEEATWRPRLDLPPRVGVELYLEAGVAYLAKMQCENGLWGVYNFGGLASYEPPPHPYFTLLAVRGLAASIPHIGEGAVRATSALEGARQGLESWLSRSALDISTSPDTLLRHTVETVEAHVALALASADGSSASARDRRAPSRTFAPEERLTEVLRSWAAVPWRGDEAHLLQIHPPRPGGYMTPIPWDQAASAKVIYYLSVLKELTGLQLEAAVSRRIDELVFKFVGMRCGGLWADFKLSTKIFPSNSTIFCLAMEKWLKGLSALPSGEA